MPHLILHILLLIFPIKYIDDMAHLLNSIESLSKFELKDLTVIEEAVIARCHAKCLIVQLKEENPTIMILD